MNRVPNDHYLPTLDGWRAVAITMVVLSHCLTTESARNGGGSILNLLTFRVGTFGVMLFFAISGFLICTRLLVEREATGTISLRTFYIRRVFRILPAAYLYLAVIGAFGLAGIVTVRGLDLAAAAFFFSNYVSSDSWFTGHFWSLAIEEHFYLLWPPILFALGRKWATWAGASLILLSIFLRHQTTSNAPYGNDLQGYTQLRLDAFMFPCLLAILLRDERRRRWFSDSMKPMVWFGVVITLGAGIAIAGVSPVLREPQRVLQSAALPLIIATTVLRPDDWTGRILRHPALEWLGRTSYSVYLWQQLVFGFAPQHGQGRAIALPLLVATILFVAALSRRWIEQPAIAFGKRFSR